MNKTRHLFMFIMTAIMMAINPQQMWADNVITLGEDGTVSEPLPIYFNCRRSYTQQLYTKEEMGGKAQLIRKICFYYNGADSTFKAKAYHMIYMGNTSKTYFSSEKDFVPINNLVHVAQTIVKCDGEGWCEITLDTPFYYDGNGGLVVAINDCSGSTIGSSSSTFRHSSTNSYMTLTCYNNNEFGTVLPDDYLYGTNRLLRSRVSTKFITEDVNIIYYNSSKSGKSNEYPVSNSDKYSYSQQLYTKGEMGGKPLMIQSVWFYYDYSSAMTQKNDVVIYMGHKAESSFSNTSDYLHADKLTQVYSGNLNCKQGWNVFTLSTPFLYNGTDNLVVAVDDNSGNYNGYSYTFKVAPTSDNKTLCYKSSRNNPDPASDELGSFTSNTAYQNRVITAFTTSPATFTLTTDVNDTSMGSVSGGGTYTHGTNAELTATPKTGYHFVNWTDGTTNYTDNPLTITVTSNKSLTAVFEKHTYSDPSWTWTGNTSATCSRTCTANICTSSTADHTISQTVTLSGGGITSSVYKHADCKNAGTTAYTAKVTVGGTEYTDTKYVDNIASTGTHYYDNGFCTGCDQYESLGNAVNGWYEIKNAGQLYSFAALANSSNDASLSKARLTKDIVVNNGTFDADGKYTPLGETEGATPRSWTPMGNSSCSFHGQVDGNGYTISGLYCNTSSEYIGFVGNAAGATIQGLGIVNGYFKGDHLVGAICGENNGGTIQRCWSDSKVVGNYYIGGICGTNWFASTVEDCYSSGAVSGSYNVGGISGANRHSATVNDVEKYSSISNCYSTATVTCSDNDFGSICGLNSEGCSVTNCYAASGDLIGIQGGNELANCEINVTAERFASGEICYLLNGGENGKTDGTQAWYQKKGTDSYPVLKKATGNTIYCVYGTTCANRTYNNNSGSGTPAHNYSVAPEWTWTADGKSAKATFTCQNDARHKLVSDATVKGNKTIAATCYAMGKTTYTATVAYNNTPYTDTKEVQDIPMLAHTVADDFDDNGFKVCTVCHADAAYQPLGYAVNDWYEIKNAGQLYSFAALANSSYHASFSKARLTKDIVVNNGTFDTNGKYTPLGETEGATPRSWTPIFNFQGQFDGDGYTISGLYCNTSSDNIGFVKYATGATIQGLGIVNGYFKGKQLVGAICGNTNEGSTIQRCWSDSKIVGTHYIGGICGANWFGSTVEDCYSSGAVSGSYNVGGICGDNYNSFTVNGVEKYSSISNCYSTATVTDPYNASGSICGWNRKNCSVTNCYASTDKLIGNQKGNEPTNCEINVTAKRFASGEICYKLNGSRSVGTDESPLVWYQTLDKDTVPKLKGMVVYYDAEREPAYYNIYPGDLNADSKYTIADLTLLIKLLNNGGTITNPAADVDGNGTVNIDDVNVLRKIILGYEGTLANINGEKRWVEYVQLWDGGPK